MTGWGLSWLLTQPLSGVQELGALALSVVVLYILISAGAAYRMIRREQRRGRALQDDERERLRKASIDHHLPNTLPLQGRRKIR